VTVEDPVKVTALPAATRFAVRGGERAIGMIGTALGVSFRREPCRAATAGTLSTLWLGPDEWLLIADDGAGARLEATINQALANEPASLVDISDRQVAFEVTATNVEDVLNAFNALDLEIGAFPVGMCTRTLFGKAEIVLWRTARETFRIEVWRSFAAYVLGCLEEARREPTPP
jgi:sarcosine oxidase subunit gamma